MSGTQVSLPPDELRFLLREALRGLTRVRDKKVAAARNEFTEWRVKYRAASWWQRWGMSKPPDSIEDDWNEWGDNPLRAARRHGSAAEDMIHDLLCVLRQDGAVLLSLEDYQTLVSWRDAA